MRGRSHNTGPIGLDIGARAIRAVQLKRTRTGFDLLAHAHIDVSPTDVEDENRVFEHVKSILGVRGFVGRNVAICIPDRALEIKNMRMPQMPESELTEAALFEARERFVNLRNGYMIRALPAGIVGADSNAQQELIVLAAPEQTIETRLKSMMNLGVQVTSIEPTATAFFRPYEQSLRRSSDANVPNAFVDFGEWNTRVLISCGDEIAFLKVCPIGGSHLDAVISKDLVMPTPDATKARLRLQTSSEAQESDGVIAATRGAIKPVIEQLAKEVALCLRYYSVTFRAERPEHVTIAGESANPVVADLISESLQVPVHVGKAFSAGSCVGAIESSELDAGLPQWTTALGLAMNEIRLNVGQKVAS
ncbi:MAG: pilus assembly protein PilM [Phycisphaerae bacterium]|nr:pilus assembly protein PilM [Phycisphaerales bacterium]